MCKLQTILAIVISVCLITPSPASAYWVWSPVKGKFVQPEGTQQRTAEEQYDYALQLKEQGQGRGDVINALEGVVKEYPQSAYASEAQYVIATMYEEEENFHKASEAYQKLISEFPRGEHIDTAMKRLYDIGILFLEGQKRKVLGVAFVSALPKSAEIFQFIVESAPYGPWGDKAQLRLGVANRKLGKLSEAIQAFEQLIENYPTSAFVDEAHYQLAETSYELSQIASRDELARSSAGDHLSTFIESYSASSLAERARELKRQLDEQDAEKNYRIGLYYEKQGFTESAMIYYEDVATRYRQTPFGEKAGERLGGLKEPLRAMEEKESEREQKLAEVGSMLEALEKDDKKATEDQLQMRERLELEREAIYRAEALYREQTRTSYKDRVKGLKGREKGLKEKIKIFEKRRKQLLKRGATQELEAALAKWETSLLRERDQLALERSTLKPLNARFREGKWWSTSWNWTWVPGLGAPKEMEPADSLVAYKEGKWQKLLGVRDPIQTERISFEGELDRISVDMMTLNERELAILRSKPLFDSVVPQSVQIEAKKVVAQQTKLEQAKYAFNKAATQYEQRFDSAFLKTLGQPATIVSLPVKEVAVELGDDTDQKLKDLHLRKASISNVWLAQRREVATLAKAAGKQQISLIPGSQIQNVVFDSLPEAQQAKHVRTLKKRLKFVEREIRRRLDQIFDWEHENTERMERLDQLIHSESVQPSLAKRTAGKIAAPVTGFFKLGKVFLFGLGDRERQLTQKAVEITETGEGSYTQEERHSIWLLHEEVQLQSFLIQGRIKEVEGLKKELNKLHGQGNQIPGFTYQSMLVPRYPTSLEYSVERASKILGEAESGEMLADRLAVEQAALREIEQEMTRVDAELRAYAKALKQEGSAETVATPPPAVAVDIEGTAETMPEVAVDTRAKIKEEMEQNIRVLFEEVNAAQQALQRQENSHHNGLWNWYQETDQRKKLIATFSDDEKAIFQQRETLEKQKKQTTKQLRGAAKREYRIVESQKDFLEDKVKALEKRLEDLEGPATTQRNMLVHEIEQTRHMSDNLVRHLATLEILAKK